MARFLGARLLGGLYVGLAVYCILSALIGPAGLLAYEKLGERRAAMSENLAALATRNERLRAELDALRSDPDRVAREARGLGYLGRDEYEFVLVGRSRERIESVEPGDFLPYKAPETVSDRFIKELALVGGLGAFLLGLLRPGKGSQRPRRLHRASRT